MNLDSIMDTYTKAHLVELLTSNERKASELNRKSKQELAQLFLSQGWEYQKGTKRAQNPKKWALLMDSTQNAQNANVEPASEGNITLTTQEPLESVRELVQYDNDFINKIESQVEARLQKKLYAGRKQEKSDKKAHKEAIKILILWIRRPHFCKV